MTKKEFEAHKESEILKRKNYQKQFGFTFDKAFMAENNAVKGMTVYDFLVLRTTRQEFKMIEDKLRFNKRFRDYLLSREENLEFLSNKNYSFLSIFSILIYKF